MAITSKSTLRDVLADPRAVAVIEEYVPGFVEEKADLLGPRHEDQYAAQIPAGRLQKGRCCGYLRKARRARRLSFQE